jgi:hypothetical protein
VVLVINTEILVYEMLGEGFSHIGEGVFGGQAALIIPRIGGVLNLEFTSTPLGGTVAV